MHPTDLAEVEAFVGIGSVLAGKYRIERLLGVGGMGAVVSAHHEQLHERVAIKFLLPRAGQNERLAARFLREARTASKLKSPHVARVYDIDSRADGAPFIVMEYLDGESLAARFQRDRELSAACIVDDVLEACVALAEAHALGVVHRDLKPANLFAAPDVSGLVCVRVLDFGISKLIDPRAPDEHITQDLPIGSPPYMSPEQLTQPSGVDHRTDIWSLGVVLYEGLSGQLPFGGNGFAEVSASILQRSPEPLSERPELDVIVRRCLAKDRERRFADIEALAQALAPYAGERGTRAIRMLGTWQRRRARVSEPAFDPRREQAPTATSPEVRDEVPTATGTADATRDPVSNSRGNKGSLRALGVTTLVALLLLVVYRIESRRELIPTGDVRPSAEPGAWSVAPAALPPPHSSSVLPPIASGAGGTPTRLRDNRSPAKQKLGRGGSETRSFDPVFDERR